MRIALGADHRGYAYKEEIKKRLHFIGQKKIDWLDYGTHSAERTDYPLFVTPVCRAIQLAEADCGVLVCASGVGMSIAANRFSGIYAALVWNASVARMSREDDKSNVLIIPSDFVTIDDAITMIDAWLFATFKEGRYQQRIALIDELGGV